MGDDATRPCPAFPGIIQVLDDLNAATSIEFFRKNTSDADLFCVRFDD